MSLIPSLLLRKKSKGSGCSSVSVLAPIGLGTPVERQLPMIMSRLREGIAVVGPTA